jgi:hypothetical protein
MAFNIKDLDVLYFKYAERINHRTDEACQFSSRVVLCLESIIGVQEELCWYGKGINEPYVSCYGVNRENLAEADTSTNLPLVYADGGFEFFVGILLGSTIERWNKYKPRVKVEVFEDNGHFHAEILGSKIEIGETLLVEGNFEAISNVIIKKIENLLVHGNSNRSPRKIGFKTDETFIVGQS